MRQDYKHLARSNRAANDSHPSYLEMAAFAVVSCLMGYGLLWLAFMQATGGL